MALARLTTRPRLTPLRATLEGMSTGTGLTLVDDLDNLDYLLPSWERSLRAERRRFARSVTTSAAPRSSGPFSPTAGPPRTLARSPGATSKSSSSMWATGGRTRLSRLTFGTSSSCNTTSNLPLRSEGRPQHGSPSDVHSRTKPDLSHTDGRASRTEEQIEAQRLTAPNRRSGRGCESSARTYTHCFTAARASSLEHAHEQQLNLVIGENHDHCLRQGAGASSALRRWNVSTRPATLIAVSTPPLSPVVRRE